MAKLVDYNDKLAEENLEITKVLDRADWSFAYYELLSRQLNTDNPNNPNTFLDEIVNSIKLMKINNPLQVQGKKFEVINGIEGGCKYYE
ncbi:hypothetical protein O9G_001641 [Rozella allomycis CSF55]|uniref:Uncharacterized protein n=1 Tax=Rozella allomycis (strain CSF55) TaxID=988480 RepID=A0A075B1R5_ROZAC|nr:hypothetical protein O9G_001641 [Rozella allomycis CSF55]|eukprot:EPZ34911.1 hypothetical protein O9G_001641 [Rozella allomycis CSF55]